MLSVLCCGELKRSDPDTGDEGVIGGGDEVRLDVGEGCVELDKDRAEKRGE